VLPLLFRTIDYTFQPLIVGAAPDAYFWADTNSTPSADGFILLDAATGDAEGLCGDEALTSQADGSLTYRIEFPEGKSVSDVLGGSISIWCRTFAANFGEIVIPTNLTDIPTNGPKLSCTESSVSLGPLAERDHSLAGDVYLISDRVLEIRNFAYDGTFYFLRSYSC
jgi:hypothetical protein